MDTRITMDTRIIQFSDAYTVTQSVSKANYFLLRERHPSSGSYIDCEDYKILHSMGIFFICEFAGTN